tara:strand:+ start:129 stop:1547 length:1419 start_codon:yes stop_codon:yes gene_type:complete
MVKDFLYNFSGRIGSVLIGFVRSIVVPRFLGPELYGVLSLFGMFRVSLGFLDLGIKTAYYHHMADVLVKKKAEDNFRTETSNYFSTQIVVNICGIILTIFAAIYLYPKYEKQSALYIVGICSIIVTHCLSQLHSLARKQTILQKRFKFMATVTLLESFLGSLFAIIGATLYSIVGVLIFQPIEHLASCIVYLKKTGGIPSFKLDLRKSWKILKNSFRYFYGSLSFVILRYSDRVLTISLLSIESLGYYTLAHAISEHIKIFIGSIHEVATPRITERIASVEKITDLVDELEEQTSLLFGITLFLMGNAFIFSELIIYLLPKFGSSIEVFRILIIGLTVGLSSFYPTVLMQSKRVGKAAVLSNISIVSSIINIGVSYTLIIHGYSIIGVAIGTLISHIVRTSFCFFYIHHFVLEKGLSASYYGYLAGPIAIFGLLYFFRDEPIWFLLLFFYTIFLFAYSRDIKECIDLARKKI